MHDAQIHDNKASNGMIVWNECLMRSETRVGRMRTEDAHRQGSKNIKNFL